MKSLTFKRGTAMFLAILICATAFVGIIPAYAASEQGMVYLNLYPIAGDSSSASSWAHSNLTYMNGWHSGSGSSLVLRAIDSFTGNICYCIEPGAPQNSGEYLTSRDESYWDNLPSTYNKTVSPDTIKVLIGRILQYGYTGKLDPEWKTQNSADADKLAKIYATQILIWETVVGERDTDFNHVSTGNYDRVLDLVGPNHPLKSKITTYYNNIAASVQNHTKVPSFTAKTASKAQTISLKWDGEKYSAEITDSNKVLDNYSFSASGLSFTKSGNTLTISAEKAPSGEVTVSVEKSSNQRKGLVTWSDGSFSPNSGRQDIVAYTASVSDPVKAYFKVNVSDGDLKIIKTSDDGHVSGIEFTVTGDSINETVKTDDSGNIEIHNLKPGKYSVKEHVAEGYIPQNEQTVTVEAGKTAVVSFSNVTIRGKVELTKVDADYPENKLTGAVFEVYSDTDANGEFDADTDEFVGNMTEAETGVYRMSDLKYGVYFAHEQAAPEGFIQDESYYRFSIITDGETAVVENKAGVGFINKPVTSKLVITKTDVSNGDLLPSAGFRIKDSDGNVVAEGYTDENGIAEFTLRYGRYTYEEFDAPDGYMIDTEPHEFEITEDGAIIKAEMTNKHQPDIPKTGDNTHIELWATVGVASLIAASGIGFRLYRKKKD